jgi:hypothetical protein
MVQVLTSVPAQNMRMDRAQSGQSVQRMAKGKTTSILLASSTNSPRIQCIQHPSPRSSVRLFPLHGWNIRLSSRIDWFASSVGAGSPGEMEGAVHVGRRLLVGGNTGYDCDDGSPRSQVQFATHDLRVLPN